MTDYTPLVKQIGFAMLRNRDWAGNRYLQSDRPNYDKLFAQLEQREAKRREELAAAAKEEAEKAAEAEARWNRPEEVARRNACAAIAKKQQAKLQTALYLSSVAS